MRYPIMTFDTCAQKMTPRQTTTQHRSEDRAMPSIGQAIRLSHLTLLIVLLTGGLMLGQVQPLAAQADAFGEVIDVRVVNLEVVVTEKGSRVRDLTPDDFLLQVDGAEVPIEYFTEVTGGIADGGNQDAAGTIPALAPGEKVGTSYLVFIDEFFSLATDRNRVLQSIGEQLPYLSPEDRMAVVAFNGNQVEMLTSWNQSVEQLEDIFRKAQGRPAYGLRRRSERRIFELQDEDLTGLNIGNTVTDLSSVVDSTISLEEQQHVDLVAHQVERVVLAASSALRSFANPPGRKVMLLLSGGWPHNPTQWVINDPQRAAYVSGSQSHGQLYGQLTETANRLSYTLYPVDVPGLGGSDIDAGDFTVEQAADRSDRRFNREQEEDLSLTSIARLTGGRAALDSQNQNAFAGAVEDTRSYYWIGFTPTWQGDDSEHKVVIKTRNKGQKVRSRQGFSDLSRETEVTMMVESSLLFGDPPSAAPLRVEVGQGKKSGLGKVIVPLRIAIPVGALSFLPHEGKWVADTELRVAVLDESGNTSDIPVIPLGIRLDAEPTADDFTVYETSMKVRRRKHDLVVSLYDKLSGKILSSKVQIDPTRSSKSKR